MARQHPGPAPLLEVRGVTRSFAAVAGVSFPRYPGEAHALVGEIVLGPPTCSTDRYNS